jgi:hypothetical protein
MTPRGRPLVSAYIWRISFEFCSLLPDTIRPYFSTFPSPRVSAEFINS